MKNIVLLAAQVVMLLSARVFAEAPCAKVYVYNGTIQRPTPADLVIKNSIEEQIKSRNGLCFMGYVKYGPEWQVQAHEKNEMLLSYTLGTLDDGNGVGEVGKRIAVITYDVYSWDKDFKHIINSGPDIAWFLASNDTRLLEQYARSAANNVLFVVALMSHDGRDAK